MRAASRDSDTDGVEELQDVSRAFKKMSKNKSKSKETMTQSGRRDNKFQYTHIEFSLY
jgi:hypothetical protein